MRRSGRPADRPAARRGRPGPEHAVRPRAQERGEVAGASPGDPRRRQPDLRFRRDLPAEPRAALAGAQPGGARGVHASVRRPARALVHFEDRELRRRAPRLGGRAGAPVAPVALMERASSALAQQPWSRLVPLFTRGGLTLGFGVIALVLLALAVLMPGIVAALLLVTFAGFVLVDACLGLGLLLFSRAARADRLGLVVRFVVGIGIAVAAFAVPVMSGQPWQRLATLVSIWAVLNGLLDVAAGCDLYGPPGQRWRVVVGAVSLCLG